MFFHSHWAAFPQMSRGDVPRRCLNLQRIHWDAEGWPRFEGGTVQGTEERPTLADSEDRRCFR